jgi:hypothetical protein
MTHLAPYNVNWANSPGTTWPHRRRPGSLDAPETEHRLLDTLLVDTAPVASFPHGSFGILLPVYVGWSLQIKRMDDTCQRLCEPHLRKSTENMIRIAKSLELNIKECISSAC